jgi:epidermal growth factor receptor substrate 15
MALYGKYRYGLPLYGAFDSSAVNNISYNASLTAIQNNYGIIELMWGTVTIDSTDTAITNWKIIRTVGGAPDYPNTFTPVVVYGTTSVTSNGGSSYYLRYNDYQSNLITSNTYTFFENYFPSGTQVTYSLWVFNGSRWVFAGLADQIITGVTETTDKVLRMLPAAWTNSVGGTGDITGYPTRYDDSTNTVFKINSVTPNSPSRGYVTYTTTTSMPIKYYGQYALISGISIDGYNGNYNIIFKDSNTFFVVNNTTNISGLDLSGATVSVAEETSLWKFLSGFTFYYDRLRTEVSLIDTISDYRHTPYNMLPLAIQTQGFNYRQDLGTSYLRSMHRVGHRINSLKGTEIGLKMYVGSLLSSYSRRYQSTNLFLNYNDSSFEESIGNWDINDGNTFSAKKYANAVTDLGVGYSTLSSPLRDGLTLGKIIKTAGYGLITSAGTSNIVLTSYKIPEYTISTVTPDSPSTGYVTYTTSTTTKYRDDNSVYISGVSPSGYSGSFNVTMLDSSSFYVKNTTTGTPTLSSAKIRSSVSIPTITRTIPITGGRSYILTGYIQKLTGNTGAANVAAQINWYDNQGYPINTNTAYSTAVTIGTSWTLFTSSSISPNYIAPSNAAYASVNIKITSPANADKFIIDMLSFTEMSESTLNSIEYIPLETMFEEANSTVLEINGFRTNLITNPGFSEGVGSWSTLNGSLIQDFTTSTYGNSCAKFTPTSSGAAVSSNWIEVTPGEYYTFSVYVKSSLANKSAKIAIEFSIPSDTNLDSAITTSANGPYYNPTINKTYSSLTPISDTQFTRISVKAKAPGFSPIIGVPKAIVSIEPDGYTAGQSWFIDSALFEKNALLLPYFQGDGGPTPTGTNLYTDIHTPANDCIWEVRPRANFVYNPSFENGSTSFYTSSFTGTSGSATLTSITTDTVGGLTFVPKPSTGTSYFGKIATNSTTTSSTILTSFKYPYMTTSSGIPNSPAGGESFAASAYVTSAVAGTYTIIFTDVTSGITYSNSFTVSTPSIDWYRIHVIGYVGKPITSNPRGFINITFTPTSSPAAVAWYVDAVQGEYGSAPTSFIIPGDANTTTITNLSETLLGAGVITNNISSVALNSPTTDYVTYTTATPHNISPGNTVTVSGVTVPAVQTISAITKNSTPTVSTDFANGLNSVTTSTFNTTALTAASTNASLSINSYTPTSAGFYAMADQTLGSFPATTTSVQVYSNASSAGEAVITANTSANASTASPFLSVVAGRVYYAEVRGIAPTSGRSVTLNIKWLDASGSVLSTTSGTAVTTPALITKSATSSSGNSIVVTSSTSLVAGTSTNPGSMIQGPGSNYLPGGNAITAISGSGSSYTLTMQYSVTTNSSTTQSISFVNPIKVTAQGTAPTGAVNAYLSISLNAAGSSNLHINYPKFLDLTTTNITVGSTANYSVGQSVVLSGITTPTGYNLTSTITGINSGTNTFIIDNNNAAGSVTGTPRVTIPNNFLGTFVASVQNISPYKFAVPVSVNYTTPTVTGGTVSITNTISGKNTYSTSAQMLGLGRSHYWPSGYGGKLSRLFKTIGDYLPMNSSYKFQIGEQKRPNLEITPSIISANSFENNLTNWNPTTSNSVLSRTLAKGSLYSEYAALSGSWATVTNTASSEATFGLYQTNIACTPLTQYDLTAAVKFPATSDLGTVTMTINWYDSFGNDAFQYNSDGSKVSSSNTFTITSSVKTTINQWYLIRNTADLIIISPPTSYSCRVTITNTPSTTRTGTNTFLVDSVTLKEV